MMDKTLYEHVYDLLNERGVKIDDLAKLVLDSQKKYEPHLTLSDARNAIDHVLRKREVQNAVLTGIVLDKMVDQDLVPDKYLQRILEEDSWQYQVDELLSTACVDVFGGVASSNRGYLDKTKPGIIGITDRRTDSCNVFLDDILAAIVSSAESYVANKFPQGAYREMEVDSRDY